MLRTGWTDDVLDEMDDARLTSLYATLLVEHFEATGDASALGGDRS